MPHGPSFFFKLGCNTLFLGGPIGACYVEHRKLKFFEKEMERKHPGHIVKYRPHGTGFDSKQAYPRLVRKDEASEIKPR